MQRISLHCHCHLLPYKTHTRHHDDGDLDGWYAGSRRIEAGGGGSRGERDTRVVPDITPLNTYK